MKRAQRLDTFRGGLEATERDCAGRMRAAEARLREAGLRLEELSRYREDYLRGFQSRSAAGIAGPSLRDYQAFVARLGEAVAQQQRLLARCEVDREFERNRWREAALQVKAVATVVDRWIEEERMVAERADQREMDEHARDIATRNLRETA